jgi:hypothetical protein
MWIKCDENNRFSLTKIYSKVLNPKKIVDSSIKVLFHMTNELAHLLPNPEAV